MDVDEKLEELAQLVEEAKSVPLSTSCMVNRAQVLDLIEEIHDLHLRMPITCSPTDPRWWMRGAGKPIA